MSVLVDLRVKNYRSLADVSLELQPVNIFFGPNGSGKSSILDVIWFLRGCAAQGVDATAAERDHGLGLLWDHAPEGSQITLAVSTSAASYELTLGFLSGRIDAMAGERLVSRQRNLVLIDRKAGSDSVLFHSTAMGQGASYTLREPERISLPRYLDHDTASSEALELNNLLRYTRLYHWRSVKLYALKKFGSESGTENLLWSLGDNLWSVLRNLQGRRAIDSRYDTILRYMRRSFPGFQDLVLESTGPNSVYGLFVEKGLSQPLRASGVSDGHLQMLLLLTALFGEGRNRPSPVLFDEPEISLHPWALAVLAEAIEEASVSWKRQVFVATHSPVLLSQFAASRILAVEPGAEGTKIRRLSEVQEVHDLLDQYSPGSLYMAELVGAQGPAVQAIE